MIEMLFLFSLFTLLSNLITAIPFNSNQFLTKRAPSSVSVTTNYGNWIGVTQANVDSFLGIPFALPPIGDLRFAPPVADNRNHSNFDASNFGPACPQLNQFSGADPNTIGRLVNLTSSIPLFGGMASNASTSSGVEDCLQLNVQRPTGIASDAKLPVMVFFYGGAFTNGNTAMFNGTSLISRSVTNQQPIIFVSVNYRVASFGFLPDKEVAADPTASVVAGLQDQRLSLQSVADNIAAFGGDPDKVTIFGESAGAISVAYQMVAFDGDISYNGKNLFRAAILESGNPTPVKGADSISGQNSFDIIAGATNCSGNSNPIACLRAVPFDDLLAATNGVFLTDEGQNLIASGRYAKVPIISGDQYDEGTLLTLGTFNITTEAELDDWLATVWFPYSTPEQRAQILVNYPADPKQGSPFDTGLLNVITPQNKRISAIVGDVVFQAGRRTMVAKLTTTQPTWSYESRVFRKLPILGSFHGSDILSVFGELPTNPTAEMQSRWIAFANNLDPNVAGYPYWPQYGSSATLLQFTDTSDPSSLITDDFRAVGMAYFSSIASTLAF